MNLSCCFLGKLIVVMRTDQGKILTFISLSQCLINQFQTIEVLLLKGTWNKEPAELSASSKLWKLLQLRKYTLCCFPIKGINSKFYSKKSFKKVIHK